MKTTPKRIYKTDYKIFFEILNGRWEITSEVATGDIVCFEEPITIWGGRRTKRQTIGHRTIVGKIINERVTRTKLHNLNIYVLCASGKDKDEVIKRNIILRRSSTVNRNCKCLQRDC